MGFVARIADSGRNLMKFFSDVRVELKRVVWPTRRQTAVYTVVVLAACAIVTVLIYVVDTAISYIFRWLLGL
ncbi:MAG: preprotein translocase subunit SecE [Bacillota bacterium]|jgi:preprotein translocase subunit SecE